MICIRSYLGDTLAVLSSEKNSPGDSAGVLSLEEEGLGLAILESEDLAVASDVELTLFVLSVINSRSPSFTSRSDGMDRGRV